MPDSSSAVPAPRAPLDAERRYQDHILVGVSRTFALTIPTLPEGLREVVGNGYLLCRIADTIEDDPGLTIEEKRTFADTFSHIVTGRGEAAAFAHELVPRLSDAISQDEKDLVAHTPEVIRLTHSFNPAQQSALARCVQIMSRGMIDYQETESLDGLPDQPAMDRYCYFVAGVVGEMLTSLFADHDPRIAARADEMHALGISFGQGLQMTNILKDIWVDRARGACWLPQEVFARHGVELRRIDRARGGTGYESALLELIGTAHGHLRNALEYTLLIPRSQAGIRRFCLWALGMAVMNLRKIAAHPDFADGAEVKITRRTVKRTVAATSVSARSNLALRAMFALAAMPLPPTNAARLLDELSVSLAPAADGVAP